jgi:AcrR family transcriptional regulator
MTRTNQLTTFHTNSKEYFFSGPIAAKFGLKYEISRNVMVAVASKDDLVLQEIIGGARALFEKFGLKKTTMEDIAKEIGKGKSSLYYYFPSKYEIFEAVVDQEITEHFAMAQKEIDKAPTAKEKLKAYIKVRLCKMNKMGNLSQVVKNDLMDNMRVVMNIKKKHEINQVNMIQEIIAKGIGTGEFREIKGTELCLIANLFAATFRGVALPMCSETFPDLTENADDIVEIMVKGIGK